MGLAKDYPGTGWYKATDTGIVYNKDVAEGETHTFDGDPTEYISVVDYMPLGVGDDALSNQEYTDNRNFISNTAERVATSNLTNFMFLFLADDIGNTSYNGQDLSHWDTSNVKNMSAAFYNTDATSIKGIENWDTSNVEHVEGNEFISMTYMFAECSNFNQDLSMLCVSKIPSEPDWFSRGCDAWTLPKPIWGTCPRGEDNQ